jgi:hypothetical protein
MKISSIGFDGLDHPTPTSLKFSDDSSNELKLTPNEKAAAYRLGEARYAQHVACATAAKPSHRAIQLTDRFVKRVHALQARNPGLKFREALQRVIEANPEMWAQYCAAQRQE